MIFGGVFSHESEFRFADDVNGTSFAKPAFLSGMNHLPDVFHTAGIGAEGP
jgi:hypothetical protein